MSFFRVYLAGIVAGIGSFYVGTVTGYLSAASISLSNNSSRVYVAKGSDAESWISSLPVLVAIPVCFAAGPLMDRFGRKNLLLFLSVPATVSFVLIAVSRNLWMIYLGRGISGLAYGVNGVVYMVYLAEISPPEIRGRLTFFFMLISHVAQCVINALAIGLTWDWIAAVCAFPPAVMGVGMIFMPESPYWLYNRGRVAAAKRSLQWLLRSDHDVETTMKQIEGNHKQSQILGKRSVVQTLSRRETSRPLIMLIFVFLFHQWNGSIVSTFYVSKFAPKSMRPAVFATIVATISLVAIFPSTVLIDRLGRRLLLIVSSILMFLATSSFGIYYKLMETNPELENRISWMPLTCMAIFYIGSSTGWAPIPFTLTGEYFPLKNRGISNGIISVACVAFLFSATKSLNAIVNALHFYGLFWIFATSCFLSLIFVVLFVPETKGKTLTEITEHFKTGKIVYICN